MHSSTSTRPDVTCNIHWRDAMSPKFNQMRTNQSRHKSQHRLNSVSGFGILNGFGVRKGGKLGLEFGIEVRVDFDIHSP
eukprot:1338784-Amorphochlora_amoeboformis.AAC.1